MKLQFIEKSVYGNIYYYPVNDAAKSIVEISGRKTLDIKGIRTLETLGKFRCEVLPNVEYQTNKKNGTNN